MGRPHAHARALLLFATAALCACSSPLDESEGKYDQVRYELCDGSGDIRLAVRSEPTGPLPPSFAFTNPFGRQFVFVTGKCEFLLGGNLTQGIRYGTLEPAEARALEGELSLGKLQEYADHRDLSCAGAVTFSVRTATGYGECACGCDGDAPQGLEAALNAAAPLYERLVEGAEPLAGPLEIVGFAVTQDLGRLYQNWPFSWSIIEIVIAPESVAAEQWPARRLEGEEAELARALRETAFRQVLADQLVGIAISETAHYHVLIRDPIPPAFAEAIARFDLVGPD